MIVSYMEYYFAGGLRSEEGAFALRANDSGYGKGS
jgi:hypothetical protein